MTQSFLNRRAMMTLMASALVAPAAEASQGPVIVATTPLLADMATRLTGLQVRALMPEGAAPAEFRLSRSDSAAMAWADLVLWHGPQVETVMAESLRKMGRIRPVFALQGDQAAWMAPDAWPETLARLRAGIVRVAPRLATTLAESPLEQDLAAAMADMAAQIAAVPPEHRILVTDDATQGPAARALGLEVYLTQSLENDPKALAGLSALLAGRRLPAIFADAAAPTTRALLKGAALRGHTPHCAGPLDSRPTLTGGPDGLLRRNMGLVAAALKPAPATA